MSKRKTKPKPQAPPFAAKSVAELEAIKRDSLAEMIRLVEVIMGEPDLQDADPDDLYDTIAMQRQHGFDLDEAGAAWEMADAELSRRRREEQKAA